MKKIILCSIGVLAAIIISILPPPAELTTEGMRFLGLIVWFVCWLAGGLVPEFITGLGLMILSVLVGICSLPEAFAPFGSETIWLMVGAFGIGHCMNKCGLLRRLAYSIMQFFPGSYTAQLLALYVSGLAISPLMPSLTAKAVLMCPLTIPVGETLGFEKGSKGMAGLFMASYWSAALLGNFFYTGSVYVGIICASLSAEQAAGISFFSWLKYFWPSFLVIAVGGFLAITFLYRQKGVAPLPEGFVREKLRELGPMSRDEIFCGIVLVVVIAGWLTSSLTGISAGLCAVIGLFLLALFQQLNGKDFSAGIPWSNITLVTAITFLSGMIVELNIPTWFCRVLSPVLGTFISTPLSLVILVAVLCFLFRWFLAAVITSGAILYTLISGFALSLGVNPLVVLFIAYVGTQNWPFSSYNATFLAGYDRVRSVVEFRSIQKMSVVFNGLMILAAIANTPIWNACGFFS